LIFNQRWKIRIGDDNHGSIADDKNAKDLNILASFIHPTYNGVAAYFDVAVLETEPLNFSKSIRPGISLTNQLTYKVVRQNKYGPYANFIAR